MKEDTLKKETVFLTAIKAAVPVVLGAVGGLAATFAPYYYSALCGAGGVLS